MADAEEPADAATPWPTTPRPATKRPCCGSTSGCGRATRRSWRRPRRCSTRSSTTPTATGWAGWAGSASTASSGSTSRKTEMTLRPEDLIAAIKYLLQLRERRADARSRRHRPPGQPASADDRRAGLRRAAQGLPQAPPHGAGADEPQGRRGHDAAQPGQSQEHLGGDRVLLRPRRAVAGGRPDQPAVDAHARAAALGVGPGRFEPQAGRLRGPRRAHFALRPHLPDRDAGRHEHRPDLQPGDLRRRGRVRLPGHAVPQGRARAS